MTLPCWPDPEPDNPWPLDREADPEPPEEDAYWPDEPHWADDDPNPYDGTYSEE